MSEKISLAGDLGSGKSTLSRILVERLGMEYYSTGNICREVAARHHISVVEMNRYMETHPELDHEIDDGLAALSDDPRPLLIDSRMAWHFTRGTFRVYLSTALEVSAARIHAAGRSDEHFTSVEETAEKIRQRQESESRRYLSFYGVDNRDLSHYDLIVDTTYASPEAVADCVCEAFAAWCEAETAGNAALVLALGPALSRSLSGLFAVTLPNARGTGLLATFTSPMDGVKARGILVLWVLALGGLLLGLGGWLGGAALLGAGLSCLYYRVMSARQFGGVTGDLAGFFLQSCELAMVLAVVLAQKIEVLV